MLAKILMHRWFALIAIKSRGNSAVPKFRWIVFSSTTKKQKAFHYLAKPTSLKCAIARYSDQGLILLKILNEEGTKSVLIVTPYQHFKASVIL